MQKSAFNVKEMESKIYSKIIFNCIFLGGRVETRSSGVSVIKRVFLVTDNKIRLYPSQDGSTCPRNKLSCFINNCCFLQSLQTDKLRNRAIYYYVHIKQSKVECLSLARLFSGWSYIYQYDSDQKAVRCSTCAGSTIMLCQP